MICGFAIMGSSPSSHPRFRVGLSRPERALRKAVRELGLRPRIHCRVHGGDWAWNRHGRLFFAARTPDLCFHQERVVVYVHGCFWHACPRHYRAPKRNAWHWEGLAEFARRKDRKMARLFRRLGFQVLTWWEHEPRDRFVERLCRTLRDPRRPAASLGGPPIWRVYQTQDGMRKHRIDPGSGAPPP